MSGRWLGPLLAGGTARDAAPPVGPGKHAAAGSGFVPLACSEHTRISVLGDILTHLAV